jgi:hypothetical protein
VCALTTDLNSTMRRWVSPVRKLAGTYKHKNVRNLGVSLVIVTSSSHYPKPLSVSFSKGIIMSFITELRVALSDSKSAKEQSRKAGEGMWANYVRAIVLGYAPATTDRMETAHKAVCEELNTIRELSKDEKNSLRSAKSVLGKAIGKGVDVWQRNEDGTMATNDAGDPMPKGKSELQDAKTDAERLLSLLEQFEKTFSKESRDPLTADELDILKGKLLTIGADVGHEWQIANAEAGNF